MNQAQLLNEVSEVSERIAEHRAWAEITFKCLEDGDILVRFTHYDKRYPRGNRSIFLFSFWKEEKMKAWHCQLDKVFEGDLIDESQQSNRNEY
ncbi:hypothetical protein KFV05_07980 [Macrococcoides canis]|uniref:hypothetical protein n=1 Tax=Macrococcoides canis TaxID=1855823 RepID=UPI0020B6692C|nr:hypothetical protein [Macrococcus canis]UTH01656.1 hypothetical protein KFV05_07980 [Macrococcus canis]